MKTNVPQITFPFIYSLMLHTVSIAILLLVSPPLYRISSDFPFVDVRLYSSFLFSNNSKSLNKPISKRAASDKTKSLQDGSIKSLLGKKESLEDKKAPEKVEGSNIARELEQSATEQIEPGEPTASIIKDAIKQDRHSEDIDASGLKSSAEELKQKAETPAEPEVDMKEVGGTKSEDPLKIARIQHDDAPMTEKAIDSLFDNEGIDNKEVKPFEKKTEEINSQPSAPLHNREAKVKVKEKIKETAAALSGKHRDKKPLIQKNLASEIDKTSIPEKASSPVEVKASGHLSSLPAAPSQSIHRETEDRAIDKILKGQEKETIADLPETKVIVLPELYGDLKFEIKIEEGLIDNLKTTVSYREFLKKQRNRPQKKSEIKYIRVEPKIINREDNIMILIIEAAGEGIYDFMIESDNKPFKASLEVKLYEKSAKQRSKTLGTMTANDKITSKILMPEGIFWDDDSYFSGYMEDSESITKFNTESGLVWKEYKE